MDAKQNSEECKEAVQIVGQPPCTCDGETKNLIEAAQNGCLKCSAAFLGEAGKRVGGTTALIQATMKGHLEIVKLLAPLEAKMQDKHGKTALMISAYYGHFEIAQLLVLHEAGMQDKEGKTAIVRAIYQSKLEIVKLLLLLEGDIADKEGKTPAQCVQKARPDIRYLFEPLQQKE